MKLSFGNLSALALAAGLGLALSLPVQAASLESELSGLIVDHPQIKAAKKTVESTGKEVDIQAANFYPTLNISGDAGYESVSTPTTRSAGKNYQRGRQSATATLTQNLFNGFETTSLVRTAKLNRDIASLTMEGTRQNILFEGISAYIDVLQQRRLVELSRTNERTIQRQLNLEDERVQRGSGVAVDVLQAKSRLQLSKERRVSFEGSLADAVSRYQQVYNHAPNLDAMTDPVPPVEMIPAELEEAAKIALTENPAITNSLTSIEVAKEKKREVKSEYFPTVDLVGTMNYENGVNTVTGVRRDYSVLLEASWDLFSGLSTGASLSQAAYDYAASKDQYDFVSRKVVEQTRIAWQALLTARERLELLENAVNIASEVFDSRKKLREAGKETVINVLDAESELNNARINYTAASYAERTAIYQLLLSMGRLNNQHLDLKPE